MIKKDRWQEIRKLILTHRTECSKYQVLWELERSNKITFEEHRHILSTLPYSKSKQMD